MVCIHVAALVSYFIWTDTLLLKNFMNGKISAQPHQSSLRCHSRPSTYRELDCIDCLRRRLHQSNIPVTSEHE